VVAVTPLWTVFSDTEPRSTRTAGHITKSRISTTESQVPQRARRRRYGNEPSRRSYSYWTSNGSDLNLNNPSLTKWNLSCPKLNNYRFSYRCQTDCISKLNNPSLTRWRSLHPNWNNCCFGYWKSNGSHLNLNNPLLTKWNIKIIMFLGSKVRRVRKADNLTAIYEQIV
jgi:hypothetical protein